MDLMPTITGDDDHSRQMLDYGNYHPGGAQKTHRLYNSGFDDPQSMGNPAAQLQPYYQQYDAYSTPGMIPPGGTGVIGTSFGSANFAGHNPVSFLGNHMFSPNYNNPLGWHTNHPRVGRAVFLMKLLGWILTVACRLKETDPAGIYAGPQYRSSDPGLGHVYSLPGSMASQQMSGGNAIANNEISGGNPTSTRYDSPLGKSQAGHWYPAPHQSNESSRGNPALTPYDVHLRNAQAGGMHSPLHYPVADSSVGSQTGTSELHSAGQRPLFDAQPHSGHGQVPASGGGSSQNTAARSEDRSCTACGTKHTPIWRRDPPNSGRTGALVCNKCGMVRRRMSEKVAAHRGRLQGQ